ncbi:MAG: hypothetical protein EAX87_11045 [Candidatus Thorarchaeota archaeon]|nr:hypothetical protein [Candidatus Thorarchaeota archaeon]
MKRKELFLVALGVVVLFAAGAFSVTAFPTQTNPCGNCHDTTGVLILTSNATGTVDATVGVPFTLMLSQTGYSGGDGKVAIAIKSGWADNAQFSFTDQGIEDGQSGDLNPTSDQVTISVTLTPLAVGSWTVRVWTASPTGWVGTSLDIAVTVSTASTTTTTTTQTTTTSTTPTTSTGTSPPTQPGGLDLMTIALVGVGAVVVIVVIAFLVRRGS